MVYTHIQTPPIRSCTNAYIFTHTFISLSIWQTVVSWWCLHFFSPPTDYCICLSCACMSASWYDFHLNGNKNFLGLWNYYHSFTISSNKNKCHRWVDFLCVNLSLRQAGKQANKIKYFVAMCDFKLPMIAHTHYYLREVEDYLFFWNDGCNRERENGEIVKKPIFLNTINFSFFLRKKMICKYWHTLSKCLFVCMRRKCAYQLTISYICMRVCTLRQQSV